MRRIEGTSKMNWVLERFPETRRVLVWHGIHLRSHQAEHTVEEFADEEGVDLADLLIELGALATDPDRD